VFSSVYSNTLVLQYASWSHCDGEEKRRLRLFTRRWVLNVFFLFSDLRLTNIPYEVMLKFYQHVIQFITTHLDLKKSFLCCKYTCTCTYTRSFLICDDTFFQPSPLSIEMLLTSVNRGSTDQKMFLCIALRKVCRNVQQMMLNKIYTVVQYTFKIMLFMVVAGVPWNYSCIHV